MKKWITETGKERLYQWNKPAKTIQQNLASIQTENIVLQTNGKDIKKKYMDNIKPALKDEEEPLSVHLKLESVI